MFASGGITLKIKSDLKLSRTVNKKASKSRQHKQTLLENLTIAKENLISGDNSAAQEVKDIENELKIITQKELEGVKIRSRSQWIEDGEKPSRYFFSLERKTCQRQLYSVTRKTRRIASKK